jgi:hypothetical protein
MHSPALYTIADTSDLPAPMRILRKQIQSWQAYEPLRKIIYAT